MMDNMSPLLSDPKRLKTVGTKYIFWLSATAERLVYEYGEKQLAADI